MRAPRRDVVVCVLLLLLASCGGGERRASGGPATVTLAARERDLQPEEDMPVKLLVFSTLTALNERGELEGRLARRWTHSADYREWTYHLRTDVRWHDGARFTAHDVKYSVDLWKNPDVQHYYTAFMEDARVVDDSTVTLRYTTSADDQIASYLTFYPKHIVERLDPKGFHRWDFWWRPVGNGPYRVVSYAPQTMLQLAANPDYYRGKPKIERVILKFVGDNALTDLLAGNIDALSWTNPAEIAKFAADPRFRVYFQPESYRGYALFWKSDHAFFRDARVRRALTLAVDRRGMQRAVNNPDDVPIFDSPFTDRQLRQGRMPPALPHDSAQARRLLNEAGWRDAEGDGVVERAGLPFRFTALVAQRGRNELAVLVQNQLRRFGISMELQPLDGSGVRERLRAGDFEAAFAPYDNNPGSLQRIRLGLREPLGYENAHVAALVDSAVTTADPDARDRIYVALGEILRADLPITFLTPRVNVVFAHRRLRGLRSPWRVDPASHMDELWVEDER